MSEENTTTTDDTQDIKTEGTVGHNKTLLNELKQARAALAAFEADKEEREAAAAKKAGDYEALLKKEQDKASKSLKERDEAIAARDARINNLITDTTLNGILASHDVQPALAKALTAMLKSELAITDDGVTLGGMSVEDYTNNFFASDEGKAFLKPVTNSGAGATGNTGAGPSTPDEWSLSTYAALKTSDPAKAAAYAKKHAKTF